MMLSLYNDISFKLSKTITGAYSTSFSLGIKAFAPEYRSAVYAIYAFVRIADEIVDTFHDYDRKYLLEKFRRDTYEAIEAGISTNPVLNSFQKTVSEYRIKRDLIDAFLKSMEMDLYKASYERGKYDEYIYGSAEVVGLMCLKVFCSGDDLKFNSLLSPAKSLGSAFQKVNFLRDIKSDLEERGRIYLPNVHHYLNIDDLNKSRLETEIESDFKNALAGIKRLPMGVKLGVYSAYLYYYVLFNKIRKMKARDLFLRRVRVSNFRKLILLIKSVIEVKVLKVT